MTVFCRTASSIIVGYVPSQKVHIWNFSLALSVENTAKHLYFREQNSSFAALRATNNHTNRI